MSKLILIWFKRLLAFVTRSTVSLKSATAAYTAAVAVDSDGKVMVTVTRTADGAQTCVAVSDDDFGGPAK